MKYKNWPLKLSKPPLTQYSYWLQICTFDCFTQRYLQQIFNRTWS